METNEIKNAAKPLLGQKRSVEDIVFGEKGLKAYKGGSKPDARYLSPEYLKTNPNGLGGSSYIAAALMMATMVGYFLGLAESYQKQAGYEQGYSQNQENGYLQQQKYTVK